MDFLVSGLVDTHCVLFDGSKENLEAEEKPIKSDLPLTLITLKWCNLFVLVILLKNLSCFGILMYG